MISVGTIAALWRFPVKSMRGEELTQALIDARGILGDRLYAVRDTDGKLGSGKDTRRFRRMDGLLDCQANYGPDLTPVITLPDGTVVRGDDEHVHWAIANAIGRPGVTLAKEDVISHFDHEPLHIVTSADLVSQIDARRFRPNMVITVDRQEDVWVGRELRIGTHLVLDITDADLNGGVHARVRTPGRVRVGDEVFLA